MTTMGFVGSTLPYENAKKSDVSSPLRTIIKI
jgi:hypothetical protein